MKSGVYIGKESSGNFDLISTGDYINPLTTTFKLKDLKKTIGTIRELYLIISDIEVEYIKVEITGKLTFVRCYLSWDNENWYSKLEINEVINKIGDIEVRPFFIKIVCDDFLEYFSLSGESSYTQYKIKLVYI